jgi:hypothetical protein
LAAVLFVFCDLEMIDGWTRKRPFSHSR